MKKIIMLLMAYCLIIPIPAFSQSWDEVQRNTDIFLFGEGWGSTVEEADQQVVISLS